MGISKKKETLTLVQVDQLILIAASVTRFFTFCADCSTMLELTLKEIKRVRLSIRNNSLPLSWDDFLHGLTNDAIKQLLERAEVSRFEMGRLWLQVNSGLDLTHIRLMQGLIQNTLSEQYGADFKVKVIDNSAV